MEFGTVYRYEQTGELNGMLRVRGLTQDDAHIFCTAEQVEEEFRNTIELTRFRAGKCRFEGLSRAVVVARSGERQVRGERRELAEGRGSTSQKCLEESGLNFHAAEGEAAFYGPKADFMVRDCIGRQWQLGTVQLDLQFAGTIQVGVRRR